MCGDRPVSQQIFWKQKKTIQFANTSTGAIIQSKYTPTFFVCELSDSRFFSKLLSPLFSPCNKKINTAESFPSKSWKVFNMKKNVHTILSFFQLIYKQSFPLLKYIYITLFFYNIINKKIYLI